MSHVGNLSLMQYIYLMHYPYSSFVNLTIMTRIAFCFPPFQDQILDLVGMSFHSFNLEELFNLPFMTLTYLKKIGQFLLCFFLFFFDRSFFIRGSSDFLLFSSGYVCLDNIPIKMMYFQGITSGCIQHFSAHHYWC